MSRKMFFIDFESWKIEAGNKIEAYNIIVERLVKGEYPDIVNIESMIRPKLEDSF